MIDQYRGAQDHYQRVKTELEGELRDLIGELAERKREVDGVRDEALRLLLPAMKARILQQIMESPNGISFDELKRAYCHWGGEANEFFGKPYQPASKFWLGEYINSLERDRRVRRAVEERNGKRITVVYPRELVTTSPVY